MRYRAYKMMRLRLWIALLSTVVVLWFIRSTIRSPNDLRDLPKGFTYSSTRFEFRFGKSTRIVTDPYNKIERSTGKTHKDVYIEEGTRVIVFTSPIARIESGRDTIEVGMDSLHHKGHMGIWSNGILFSIDAEGIVNEP